MKTKTKNKLWVVIVLALLFLCLLFVYMNYKSNKKDLEICNDFEEGVCDVHISRCYELNDPQYKSICLLIGSSCKITVTGCLINEGGTNRFDREEIEQYIKEFWEIRQE